MKTLISALILIFTVNAHAVPIVNENVASGGIVTIYPDHADPHRFYIAPNMVTVAKTPEGNVVFTYFEARKSFFEKEAYIQTVLGAAYTTADLAEAKAEILKRDPQAQFSGVPFIDSLLEMTGELPDLIAENQCEHQAGLIGQEQACGLKLTPRGRTLFLKSLARKTLFITLNFKYSIQGVVRKADNTFEDEVLTHAIAVRIDGAELIARKAAILY